MRRSMWSILAAVAVTQWGCGAEPAEPVQELRPVRTARVMSDSVSVPRTLAGVARSGVEAKLSFRVGGTVAEVNVSVGDRVRRGQRLARLDPIDYELRVEEAEAALAQAAATLRRAEADFDRVRSLYENNNASKSEYDAARAAAESANAQVEAANKRLQQARQQLGYTVLTAPAPGAIASVGVEINENVKSGEQVVLLTAESDLEVEVAVPEVLIGRIELGQPVSVRFDALPGRTFAARLSEVGVAVTGAASTYPVTAELEDAAGVRSGMAAEVTFQIEDRSGSDALVVPAVAVGEDQEGRFVFVLEEGEGGTGVVRRRSVEIGRPIAGLAVIEILGGLEAGERVVTAGVRRLSDGLEVRTLDAAESAG